MTHECSECAFVTDAQTLFTFLVSRDSKEKATEKPKFVGRFTMLGWSGHLGCYLFKCKLCKRVSVDYPHGYTDFGLMFLRCSHCSNIIPLEVTEERAIYERGGIHVPKPKREGRIQDLKDVIADVEKEGIRVIVPGMDKLADRNPRGNVWKVGMFLLVVLVIIILFAQVLN